MKLSWKKMQRANSKHATDPTREAAPPTPAGYFLRRCLVAAALGLSGAGTCLAEDSSPYVVHDAPLIAIEHVTVIDGTGAPPRPGQTVLIRDGLIDAVEATSAFDVPPGAERIDGTGKTLIPGLVMVHEHLIYPAVGLGYNHQAHSFPPLYLAGGATTVRTAGGPLEDRRVQQQIEAGAVIGPDIVLTGPHINGPDFPIWVASTDAEDARRRVRIATEDGAAWHKAYMHLSVPQFEAILDEARATGTLVTGHLCSISYREAADAGIDNLEHGFYAATDFVADRTPGQCPPDLPARGVEAVLELQADSPEMRDLFRVLIDHGVAITATDTVLETLAPGRPVARPEVLDALEPASREYYLRRWADLAAQADTSHRDEMFLHNMALQRAFAEAGGLLVVGTDPTGYGGVVAGYSNQRALELLVEAGFGIPGAVQVATRNGARLLRMDERIGTISPGKDADLVLIDGLLADDISHIRNTELVFKHGVAYDSRALFDSVRGTVGLH